MDQQTGCLYSLTLTNIRLEKISVPEVRSHYQSFQSTTLKFTDRNSEKARYTIGYCSFISSSQFQ